MGQFSEYVNHYADLKNALSDINKGETSAAKWWLRKLGNPQSVSAEAFGKAHWDMYGKAEKNRHLTGPAKKSSVQKPTPHHQAPLPTTSVSPIKKVNLIDEKKQAEEDVKGMPDSPKPAKLPDPEVVTVSDGMLVEKRMEGLIDADNPFNQAVQTQVKQRANEIGVLNTTMAVSAGLDAVIKNALPIAQQDASTTFTQSLENQRAKNQFTLEDWRAQNTFSLTTYGFEVDTYNNSLNRTHAKNENALTREHEKTQNELERNLRKYLGDLSASVTESEGRNNRQSDCISMAQAQYNKRADDAREDFIEDNNQSLYDQRMNQAKAAYASEKQLCKTMG